MTASLSSPGRALVRAPVAPMYADPMLTSIQISQRLSGHVVDLLDADDDWFLARGADAYQGWIHRGFLSPVPAAGARRSSQIARVSLGCVTAIPNGGRRALPLGAYLSPSEVVKSGDAIDHPALPMRFPRAAIAITRSAQDFFQGTSYLWGGITPWGADCSGFVQTIFAMHGIQLPRDAWQQSGTGDEAGGLNDLEAADLAFFSDRDDKLVTHVAIALGSGRLAHLALGRGGFAVETLGDRKDRYVAKLRERFLGARRVL
ncbi:MAG: NlpC/P60 family protein [Gemmatimonadaceae bacterium]